MRQTIATSYTGHYLRSDPFLPTKVHWTRVLVVFSIEHTVGMRTGDVMGMIENPPINLEAWIEANKQRLSPPIGNFQFWKTSWQNFIVMMVWGAQLPARLS